MVQVIKREWEISKTYAHEVVMRNNMVCLDWTNFEIQAGEGVAEPKLEERPQQIGRCTTSIQKKL